jgi:hypothetical protein
VRATISVWVWYRAAWRMIDEIISGLSMIRPFSGMRGLLGGVLVRARQVAHAATALPIRGFPVAAAAAARAGQSLPRRSTRAMQPKVMASTTSPSVGTAAAATSQPDASVAWAPLHTVSRPVASTVCTLA